MVPEFVAAVTEHDSGGNVYEGRQRAEESSFLDAEVQHVVEIAGDVHQSINSREYIDESVQPDHPDQFVGEDCLNNNKKY